MLQDIIINLATRSSNKVGIETNKGCYTYQQILFESTKVANFLKDKVKPNDHVGLIFNNEPEFIFTFLGILMVDAVAVPIAYNAKKEEVEKMIQQCDISLYISLKPLYKDEQKFIDYNKIRKYKCDSFQFEDNKYNRENSLACILSTSGSTGNFKAVMLSHKNIVENSIAHAESIELKKQDKFLITMPLHFSSTITTQIFSCFYSEVPIYLCSLPIFPRKMLDTIKFNSISCFAAVPTFLNVLVNAFRNENSYGKVKLCIASGSKYENHLHEKLVTLFPNITVLQTYGLTEASPRVSIMDKKDSKLTCGKPVKNVEVKIIDSNGEILGDGSIGEIHIKGPNVMMGYYKNEEATKKVIVNGWLKTGDIGYLDNLGNLNVVSRQNNVINSGGINIYPEEVEEILMNFGGIKEILVLGEDNTLYGEIPIAYLTVNNHCTINKELLKKFCIEKISNYKIPKKWFVVKELPVTKTGKIIRDSPKDKLIIEHWIF
ncbi:class I adenylate-forming enzyme family protein [Metabacillus fastidiosus]|uniref:class I adenylate-forming enzyme family protein n=1 Tax=Metabacillus fastidiosus TaxID=1458 RepID=UPI003D289307